VDCHETRQLIHGYVDGELDLLTNLEVEQHLRDCPPCAQTHADLQAVRAALRGGALSFRAPPGLSRRVRSALAGAGPINGTPRRLSPRWLAVAAAAVLVLAAGGGLVYLAGRSDAERVLAEVVAGHVRSQMLPGQRVDVASSDRHTVKPWFEGKIDFTFPVPDLESQGFHLVGGRLDYLDRRPVAALVYQRRRHHINLFVWPAAPGAEASPRAAERQGYHVWHWVQAGMTYWAVSDLNDRELQEFVRECREQTRGSD
jgi:anti-sigma factor RsiW